MVSFPNTLLFDGTYIQVLSEAEKLKSWLEEKEALQKKYVVTLISIILGTAMYLSVIHHCCSPFEYFCSCFKYSENYNNGKNIVNNGSK